MFEKFFASKPQMVVCLCRFSLTFSIVRVPVAYTHFCHFCCRYAAFSTIHYRFFSSFTKKSSLMGYANGISNVHIIIFCERFYFIVAAEKLQLYVERWLNSQKNVWNFFLHFPFFARKMDQSIKFIFFFVNIFVVSLVGVVNSASRCWLEKLNTSAFFHFFSFNSAPSKWIFMCVEHTNWNWIKYAYKKRKHT